MRRSNSYAITTAHQRGRRSAAAAFPPINSASERLLGVEGGLGV